MPAIIEFKSMEDEEVLETPQANQTAEWLAAYRPVATFALMAACVVWWLITEASGVAGPTIVSIQFGAQHPALVGQGEWWRILSSAFVHQGIFDLAASLIGLYWLGNILERFLGPWKLLALFTVASAGGSLMSMLLFPLPTAGASGGIFGWLGALGFLYFKHRAQLPQEWIRKIGSALALVFFLNVMMSIVQPSYLMGAQFAGIVFGVLWLGSVPPRPGWFGLSKPWTVPMAAMALVNVPILAIAGIHAAGLQQDPWAVSTLHYADENFEIDYPVVLRHFQRPEVTEEVKIKNIAFDIPFSVGVDVGILTQREQAALKEARETLISKFKDESISWKKIESLQIRGEPWTRYWTVQEKTADMLFWSRTVKFEIEFYIHEPTQWHLICGGREEDYEHFRPVARKMAESFRKK